MPDENLGKNVILSESLIEKESLVTNDESVVDILKQLDLSTYESLAYYSLLKLNEADVNKLLKITRIPTGRIYDVLNSLVHKGILTVQETRPKKYLPVDPSVALNKLLEIKKSNFDSEITKLQQVSADLEEKLNEIKRIETRDNTFWSLILDRENAHPLVCDRINNAKIEALVFVDSIHSKDLCFNENKPDLLFCGLAITLGDLEDAQARNVDIKILMNKKSVCYEHLQKQPDQLEKIHASNYNLKFTDLNVMHFDVIDEKSVLQRIINPTNPEEVIGTIVIKDKHLAKKLRAEYLKIWDKAEVI